MSLLTEKIKFKTDLIFKGSIDEFQKFASDLAELNKKYDVIPVRWPWPIPGPGYPIPFWRFIPRVELDKLIAGRPRIKWPGGLDGGMDPLHIHIGDEVILLGKELFSEIYDKAMNRLEKEIGSIKK